MRAVARLAPLVAMAAGGALAELEYLGVAMSGIDFGCAITGECPLKTVALPLKEFGGGDGKAQMEYFVKDDKLNIFRLPTSWQYIVNDKLGGKLDDDNFGNYDLLMKTCLDTGAYCMIDIHNFARWDGDIIGQGGSVTDQDFVDLWVSLAKHYADNDKIVFGLMNEPHDLDIDIWAQTCQKVVTGIRKAGATSQIILLPGTNFASAETFVSTGSADALANITNPDGSYDGLLMDLHKYLDINNSGTHRECTTNNVEGFKTIAKWLKENNRTAMVSETGASTDDDCMVKFCQQNEYIAKNTDVFVGFVGWSAGSFDDTYILTLTPLGKPGSYTENKLMQKCILDIFNDPSKQAKPQTSSTSSATKTKDTSVPDGTTGPIFHETTDETTPSPSPSDSAASTSTLTTAGGVVLALSGLFQAWMI